MGENRIIHARLWTAEAVTKNTSTTSAAIDLLRYRPSGYFAVQVIEAGNGTGRLQYLTSQEENGTFVTSTGAVDIFNGFTKTSGPGADGIDQFSFQPIPCRWLKFKITETATASDLAFTLTYLIQ